MSSGPGVQKNTDGGWVRDMMENQAKYNRQVAGVQDPPQGTYGDTWTGGETPPSRPSAAKNPVTRPQMRNEVSGVAVWPNEAGMVGLAARSICSRFATHLLLLRAGSRVIPFFHLILGASHSIL